MNKITRFLSTIPLFLLTRPGLSLVLVVSGGSSNARTSLRTVAYYLIQRMGIPTQRIIQDANFAISDNPKEVTTYPTAISAGTVYIPEDAFISRISAEPGTIEFQIKISKWPSWLVNVLSWLGTMTMTVSLNELNGMGLKTSDQ